MLRRTNLNRAGGGLFHRLSAAETPSADLTKGFFCHLNGPMSALRIIDIKWMMNRCVDMHREYYIATPMMWYCTWEFVYGLPMRFIWNDAKPPREVDWNSGKAGFLPEGFVPTKVNQ